MKIDRRSVTRIAYSFGYSSSGTMTLWISASLLSGSELIIDFSGHLPGLVLSSTSIRPGTQRSNHLGLGFLRVGEQSARLDSASLCADSHGNVSLIGVVDSQPKPGIRIGPRNWRHRTLHNNGSSRHHSTDHGGQGEGSQSQNPLPSARTVCRRPRLLSPRLRVPAGTLSRCGLRAYLAPSPNRARSVLLQG